MRNFKITVNGSVYDVSVEETNSQTPAITPLATACITTPAPAQVPASKAKACGTPIKSPMPGMVLDFKVQSGAQVKKGQVVLILEAMKMENDITAPQDGVITYNTAKGSTVQTGDVLAVIS